jgi:hypothetical protein
MSRSARRWLLIGLGLSLASRFLAAESGATYEQTLASPSGVVDLFLTCPYVRLEYYPGSKDFGEFWYSSDGRSDDRQQDLFAKKRELLSGALEADLKPSIKVIDEKNGYIRIAEKGTDLTFVYYKFPDGSFVPAFRLRTTGGEGEEASSEVAWGFYNVVGGEWTTLDCGDLPEDNVLFPKDFLRKLLGHDPDKNDLQNIRAPKYASRRFWDICLPRVGTTAYLIPVNFWAEGEGDPSISFGGGGFQGIPIPGRDDFNTWFDASFSLGDGSREALELKWNKASKRFVSGKVLGWDLAQGQPLGGQ